MAMGDLHVWYSRYFYAGKAINGAHICASRRSTRKVANEAALINTIIEYILLDSVLLK